MTRVPTEDETVADLIRMREDGATIWQCIKFAWKWTGKENNNER